MRIKFKGAEFEIAKGTTHPEYSHFTFTDEEREFRERYWNVLPGEVVFDVGASYGAYALTAAALGARVYAFEPEKTVFDDLVRNVALNPWHGMVDLANFGLWSKPASVAMESYAPHWPKQTISSDYAMETLDNVARGLKVTRIDWIKIDVEGAEVHVVRGALDSIRRYLPKMIVECHVFLDDGLTARARDLISLAGGGCYLFEEVDRPPCTMLIATPRIS